MHHANSHRARDRKFSDSAEICRGYVTVYVTTHVTRVGAAEVALWSKP